MTEFPHLHLTLRKDGKAVGSLPRSGTRRILRRGPPLGRIPRRALSYTPGASSTRASPPARVHGRIESGAADAGIRRPRTPPPSSPMFVPSACTGATCRPDPTGPDGKSLAENKAPPLDRAKAQWMVFSGMKRPGGWISSRPLTGRVPGYARRQAGHRTGLRGTASALVLTFRSRIGGTRNPKPLTTQKLRRNDNRCAFLELSAFMDSGPPAARRNDRGSSFAPSARPPPRRTCRRRRRQGQGDENQEGRREGHRARPSRHSRPRRRRSGSGSSGDSTSTARISPPRRSEAVRRGADRADEGRGPGCRREASRPMAGIAAGRQRDEEAEERRGDGEGQAGREPMGRSPWREP